MHALHSTQALRQTEVNVLGYRIDHVRVAHATSNPRAVNPAYAAEHDDWREVLCPMSGEVLATFSSRAEAERYIIDRELASAQRAVRRNAA
jgi:hypothetical protein